jgi:hypothetical protein
MAFESARGGAVERIRGRLGGSGGEDATQREAGVGPSPDRVPAAARAGGALCFEQERAAPGR